MKNSKGGYQIVNLSNIVLEEEISAENKRQFDYLKEWFNNGKNGELKPILLTIIESDSTITSGFATCKISDDKTTIHYTLVTNITKIDVQIDVDQTDFEDITIYVIDLESL